MLLKDNFKCCEKPFNLDFYNSLHQISMESIIHENTKNRLNRTLVGMTIQKLFRCFSENLPQTLDCRMLLDCIVFVILNKSERNKISVGLLAAFIFVGQCRISPNEDLDLLYYILKYFFIVSSQTVCFISHFVQFRLSQDTIVNYWVAIKILLEKMNQA